MSTSNEFKLPNDNYCRLVVLYRLIQYLVKENRITQGISASGEKEKYLITFPRLVIAGLLVASPYIELSDTSYIASSSGYLSTVRISHKFKQHF